MTVAIEQKGIMRLEDVKIMVIGPGVWGKGDTLTEALAMAKKAGDPCRHYLAYIIHPDTWVDDDGAICSPHEFRPKEFHRVLPKKARSRS